MALSIFLTLLSMGIVASQLNKDPGKGFSVAVFFIVLFPKSVFFGKEILSAHRLLLMLLIVFSFSTRNSRSPKQLGVFYKFLIAICLFKIISALLGFSIPVSLKSVLVFSYEIIVFYSMSILYINSKEDVYRTTKYIFTALVITSFLGLYERYAAVPIASFLPRTSGALVERAVIELQPGTAVTYATPILFGLAMTFGWVLGFFFIQKEDKSSTMNLFFVVTMLANVYFSLSRGAWLSTALAMGVLFVFSKPAKKYLVGLLVVIIITLLVNKNILDSISRLALSTFDPDSLEGGSFNYRFVLWERAFQFVCSSVKTFFFGFGEEATVYIPVGQAQLSSGNWITLASWDAELAIVLFENGVCGLGLYILLFFYGAVFLLKKFMRSRSESRYYYLSTLAIFVAYFFMTTNVAMFIQQISFEVWGVLGMSEALSHFEKKQHHFPGQLY